MFYCISFLFILYFFSKFHKTSISNNKTKLIFFSALYILFVISYDPYFEWIVWILISLLLYCVLDDILHKEFNILLPIFVAITFLLMKPSLFLSLSILFVLGSFYLFAFLIFILNKLMRKDIYSKSDLENQSNKTFKKSSTIFSNHSGMGEGDPWIVCSFLLLLPIFHWIQFLFLTWVFIILFFVINRFKNKDRESIPFAPILLASLTTYLFLQQYFFN